MLKVVLTFEGQDDIVHLACLGEYLRECKEAGLIVRDFTAEKFKALICYEERDDEAAFYYEYPKLKQQIKEEMADLRRLITFKN